MFVLYFEDEDSNICMPLIECLENTDELKEVTLIEAIPEKESMYCFCTKEWRESPFFLIKTPIFES